MQNWPILFICLILFFSCGKNVSEETLDVVLEANIELSHGNCQNAIDTLENYGRQNKNALYLKTLASSYACRAGYSSVTFFGTDFANTASPAPLGGTSTYSTSAVTFQTPLEFDPDFVDIQTAINILLYAGGIASTTEPTAAERTKYFTTAELADMHTLLMFLELVQLGKILKVYGNASSVGVKGGGTVDSNVCFSDYASIPANVETALNLLTGACAVKNNTGSTQLNSSVTTAVRRRRMCHGVVLLNGFLDSLTSVISSASGNLSTIGTAASVAVTLAQTALTVAYPGIGIVKSTINQNLCEDTSLVSVAQIESFYALMFESIIE